MSTRAYIARERKVGEFECVYNHSAGYPDYLGRILKRNFRHQAAVDGLMAGGDISFIHTSSGHIERARKADASRVMADHTFWAMMDTHQIDFIYIYRKGAWKAYDFGGKEIEIP